MLRNRKTQKQWGKCLETERVKNNGEKCLEKDVVLIVEFYCACLILCLTLVSEQENSQISDPVCTL